MLSHHGPCFCNPNRQLPDNGLYNRKWQRVVIEHPGEMWREEARVSILEPKSDRCRSCRSQLWQLYWPTLLSSHVPGFVAWWTSEWDLHQTGITNACYNQLVSTAAGNGPSYNSRKRVHPHAIQNSNSYIHLWLRNLWLCWLRQYKTWASATFNVGWDSDGFEARIEWIVISKWY